MLKKYPSFLGVFAALILVASFVIPMNLVTPASVSADPGIMKWDYVNTPGLRPLSADILNEHGFGANTGQGSEILDMAPAGDGMTIWWIVRDWFYSRTDGALLGQPWLNLSDNYANMLYYTSTSGIGISASKHLPLLRKMNTVQNPGMAAGLMYVSCQLYQVAVAPDDPKFVVVTSDNGSAVNDALGRNSGPRLIWVTTDAGVTWDLAFDGFNQLGPNEYIRDIDISMDYGGKRDVGFVTVSPSGGRWVVRPSAGFATWAVQPHINGAVAPAFTGADPVTPFGYEAIKFSPTYNGDASVALVAAINPAAIPVSYFDGTYFNVAARDLNVNSTTGWAYTPSIEVRNPAGAAGDSPNMHQLNNVSLQLPSDFSGQSSSLRRAYISLDAYFNGTAKGATSQDGIYRIDDTITYLLMDTTADVNKSIYSIAYFGTYASGKLLAGERTGFPCTATVPTWFTDSPTTCPIPCWYPALKPTTGAANQMTCATGAKDGYGGALVGWNADGSLGLVSTNSLPWTVRGGITGFDNGSIELPGVVTAAPSGVSFFWGPAGLLDAINNDESAFALSRNNGETWNQIGLIDTTQDWYNDVAVAPDCTTIYLASVNRNLAGAVQCNEFDSVWRSTINPNVAAPLPAVPPLGMYWERVYLRTTSGSCAIAQSDMPILRVVPSCTDKKDGEIVGWAATRANATAAGGGVMAWSPDFGDFWANITPRNPVQDFAFESSTMLYTLDANGLVQKLPYTGTSWATNLPSADTVLLTTHTIYAVPDGKVIVGGAAGAPYAAAFSANKGESFSILTDPLSGHGNEHVIFDVDFKNNNFVYMGDDAAGGTMGTVYRNTVPSFGRWADGDMMNAINGATGIPWPAGTTRPPHPRGIFGLAMAWTGDPQPALYAAHDNFTGPSSLPTLMSDTAVCRALKPRDGMPKPGISWDCLDIFTPLNTSNVWFTLEPTSLKYCGCCTLDTNTTLYAVDDERGVAVRTTAAGPGRYNAGLIGLPGYTPSLNQGMLWAYTDCLAKKGPVLKAPADKLLVGADPVTGRSQQIDLSWEQLCLATSYELQIAKDTDFTMRVNPTMTTAAGSTIIASVTGSIIVNMDDFNMTRPAVWISPGALPEAGAIYWWRVRVFQSATQQLARSPWSEKRSFTVKAGFIVNTPYYGVQLLSPDNDCHGCKTKPASFSWSPWKETTKYQFDLAKDPEFKSMVVTATTATTGYEYTGTLDYSTNYFWRVKALQVNGQDIPSDWSATFSMQTEPAPASPAAPPAEPATPLWVWIIIAIGAILVIVTLILIFRTRRV